MSDKFRLLGEGVNRADHKFHPRTREIRHLVLHTSENTYKTGHRGLSEYGASTSRSASWHCQIGADGMSFQLPPTMVANHVRGNNATSLGVEMVMRASDWSGPGGEWRDHIFEQLVAQVTTWVMLYQLPVTRPKVPRFKVVRTPMKLKDGTTKWWKTRVADNAVLPAGIYAHADLDPDRRHDPGRDFPWDKFFAAVDTRVAAFATNNLRPKKETPMVPTLKTEDVEFLTRFLSELREVDARPTSLVYTLRLLRALANELDIPANEPEKVVRALVELTNPPE